ncbi:unnamed protein product, partial [Amoebophrya sp. A25]
CDQHQATKCKYCNHFDSGSHVKDIRHDNEVAQLKNDGYEQHQRSGCYLLT